MSAEQFVYWLNGYLELSGAQEMSAAQVKSVREHLALVLHKVTPPLENPKPTYFGGGVKCEVCQNWCSNEGGVCNKCQQVTVFSSSVYFPPNRIDPFSSPEPGPTGHCDGCGKQRKNSELSAVSTDNLAGVVMCGECRQPNTNPATAAVHSAERWPIVDVPCVLTC